MNNLKLLMAFEKKLELNGYVDFVSFDINMGTAYVSDHNKIYGVDLCNLNVKLTLFKLI